MAASRDFVSRRLHSLLGVVPIGIFLTQHLIVNHFATEGPAAFNRAAHFMENLPFRIWLEIFIIYLPLLFHGIYGLYIAFQAKNNLRTQSYFRNWMFFLQRVTGILLVVFISWHVWQTRVQVALGAELNYQMMAEVLDHPLMVAWYIIGVLSAVFHFSNGLWSFLVTWGITVTPRSQRILTYVTLGVFIVLSIIGIRAVLAFTEPAMATL